MSSNTWRRWLHSLRAGKRAPRRRGAPLRLEALEERALPSVTITPEPSGTAGPAGNLVEFRKGPAGFIIGSNTTLSSGDALFALARTDSNVIADATDNGVAVINYQDTGGGNDFANPRDVGVGPLTAVKTTSGAGGPNSGTFNPNAQDDEVAMESSGFIFIPAAGAWTFVVKSDDGFRLTMGANNAVVGEFNGGRGASYGDNQGGAIDSVVNVPAAGYYPYHLLWIQGGSLAMAQFTAAQGSFPEPTNGGVGSLPAGSQLVGDTADGGLAVFQSFTAAPVAAEIPGAGVWRFEDLTGWRQLTTANASLVGCDSRGAVAVEIPGAGVWRFEDAGGWRQLTPADAALIAVANGAVAVEIPNAGVWRFEDATGWRQLTTANASRLDVDGRGDVAVEIPGAGVWRFEDAAAWRQLTTADASQVSIAGNGTVAIAIQGAGVWRWQDAGGWKQLTTADAARLDVDGNGDVAAEITGAGVWRFEDVGGWQQLTTSDASLAVIDAFGDVAVEIPGSGVWRWEDASGWTRLTPADTSALDA